MESSARQQMISHDNIDIEKNKNDTIHYDDDINDGCKVIIMRTVIITIMEVMKFVIRMIIMMVVIVIVIIIGIVILAAIKMIIIMFFEA